ALAAGVFAATLAGGFFKGFRAAAAGAFRAGAEAFDFAAIFFDFAAALAMAYTIRKRDGNLRALHHFGGFRASPRGRISGATCRQRYSRNHLKTPRPCRPTKMR